MPKRILVAKEVNTLSPSLQETMGKPAFDPMVVEGLVHVLEAVRDHRPALILFEVISWDAPLKDLLWQMNQLRSARSVRKIILSSNGGIDETVAALELGADDFLLKPISARELEARIAAALRVHQMSEAEADIQTVGTLRLDRDSMELSINGATALLTSREFHLLGYMMDHAGEVLSRQDLLDNVWHPGGTIEDPRVVDVFVCRLRDKIESDPADPKILLTRRGEGYSLVDPAKHF
jgi:two-component system response regulator VicR